MSVEHLCGCTQHTVQCINKSEAEGEKRVCGLVRFQFPLVQCNEYY